MFRGFNYLTFKAMHSYAYRAPVWRELLANPDLNAERSKTTEFGIVYKTDPQNIFRFNIYSTKIKDMIVVMGKSYSQYSNSKFLGAELEYVHIPSYNSELRLQTAYIDAKDEQDNDMANIASVLASSSFTYTHSSGLTFGSLLKYISSVNRDQDDLRDDMSSSFIVDQSISYDFKHFTFSATLKDIFDEGLYYASPKNTYENDFSDYGRRFLIKATWEF